MSAALAIPEAAPEVEPEARAWRARLPYISLAVVALFAFVAAAGQTLAPYNAYQINLVGRLQPPFWMAGGSVAHLLGTDELGRDLLSRIIVGARVSFVVAVLGIVVGGTIGGCLGLIAAYRGGKLEAVIMRCADASLAFPILLFAIMLAVIVGPGIVPVLLTVILLLWARFARLVRAEVLSLKQREFVLLARLGGSSSMRIMLVHIVPNITGSFAVLFTLQIGVIVILEATLSFLGAGVPPPTPTWGNMIAGGRDYIADAWWLSVFPGLAVTIVVLAFNLLGDWLRDYLDPKLRQA
ncbi:MAG TPA: ABC transporter permease [Chloroflexota bacterium]|nr:ABC transporter permease [Chloroflexota bacterium]